MTKKPLKKYTGLSDQAEEINSYDSYKELIEIIREATHEELHGWMRDTETILEVLVRGEAKGNSGGLRELTKDIMELGELYLRRNDPKTPQYTYEFIEQRRRRSTRR